MPALRLNCDKCRAKGTATRRIDPRRVTCQPCDDEIQAKKRELEESQHLRDLARFAQ